MPRPTIACAAAVLLLAVAGCAASQLPVTETANLPGFLLGFWQGLIAPITFVISLFDGDVRIYAFPNGGRWYDFGFMLGIGGFTGGVFAGSRGKR
jgi:hypothetical protein